MNMNRNNLRKILNDFNSISNRLLQADYNDYTDIVKKYVKYIKKTPLIYDYIQDCGAYEGDLEQEFKEVGSSYGRMIFSLGDEPFEEVRNVFAILEYIADHEIEVSYGIALGYSSSNKYQDKIKGFNDRVVMVLIRHLENYLTDIGIQMGLDDRTNYTITVNNGQVNIANDNASINANNLVSINGEEVTKLIQAVKDASLSLSPEECEVLNGNLNIIEEECKKEEPKKSFIKTALNSIKFIKGTAEFAAAVTALFDFFTGI